MTSALLLTTALLITGAGENCFIPTEQTAGWKRVDIPDDAPALSAPADIEQFRTGEPAWIHAEDPRGYTGSTDQSRGRMDYTFEVPTDARRLEVRFIEVLRGSKVDVTVYGPNGRSYPIWSEQRVAGNSLEVSWSLPEIDYVVVRVHHHLRPIPVVAGWRTSRWVELSANADIPAMFRVTRSLYFRHPGGRTVELCDQPGQILSLQQASLVGTPSSVTLRRVTR